MEREIFLKQMGMVGRLPDGDSIECVLLPERCLHAAWSPDLSSVDPELLGPEAPSLLA